MNQLIRKFSSRKGVTMMELVIALVIITVVTAAAMSLLITTTTTEAKVAQRMAAAECGESVIECFRFAQTQEQFAEALKKLDNTFVTETQPYTLDKGGYQCTVTVVWGSEGKDKLDFVAKNAEGKEILQLHYEK